MIPMAIGNERYPGACRGQRDVLSSLIEQGPARHKPAPAFFFGAEYHVTRMKVFIDIKLRNNINVENYSMNR
jgi:hypothetical protein